jgi:hypothetical protein
MSESAGEPDVLFVEVGATCHTEGCENAGVPITLLVPEDVSAYQCGACGEPIDDVLPVHGGDL